MTLLLADLSFGPEYEVEGLKFCSLLSVGAGPSSQGLPHRGWTEDVRRWRAALWMLRTSLGKEMSHPVSQPWRPAFILGIVPSHCSCLSPWTTCTALRRPRQSWLRNSWVLSSSGASVTVSSVVTTWSPFTLMATRLTQGLLAFPFQKWENWGSEMLNTWSSQLGRGWGEIQIQV